MNLRLMLCISIIILTFVEQTDSTKIRLNKDVIDAPLVLKKKRDSLNLELAIPCNYLDNKDYVSYTYEGANFDEVTVQEPEEAIKIACPAREPMEFLKEADWIERTNVAEDSKLLFLEESNNPEDSCKSHFVPSIRKVDKNSDGVVEICGRSGTELYDVGYPVTSKNDDFRENWTKDIEFMSMYQICHSVRTKTTHYSIHRIVSPSLLLRKLWSFYELNPRASYKSYPGGAYASTQYSLYKKHYTYQLVGFDDMPVKVWKLATLFSFNYIFIPENKTLFKSIIAVDNYIRLYSKVKNQPLTIYSGVYQTSVEKPPTIPCAPNLCKSKEIQVKSLWRIIMNDEGNAAIIVTQFTLMKCDIPTYICHEKRVILKKYGGGGCTYKCSVDENVLNFLSLPPLKHSGELILTLPKPIHTEATLHGEEDPSLEKSLKYANITDFIGKVDFMKALKRYDLDLASTVEVASQIDKSNKKVTMILMNGDEGGDI